LNNCSGRGNTKVSVAFQSNHSQNPLFHFHREQNRSKKTRWRAATNIQGKASALGLEKH